MKYFFETIKDKNEPLFFYGAISMVGALICFVLSKYSSIQILGISGWIKPFKFFLSVSIFVFTMVLYLQFLENQKQVTIYSWSIIVLFSVELFFIVLQAARGKTSHYNLQTTLDSTISIIMGLTIILFMLHTVFIVFLFFNQKYFEVDKNMVLALKLSLSIMVLFAFEGFVMVSVLKHTIGSEDGSAGLPIVNWSRNHGDLRVAHFFGMHALQLIPLVTYLLAKRKRDVIIISALYFIFVTYTLVHALQGKSITKLLNQ